MKKVGVIRAMVAVGALALAGGGLLSGAAQPASGVR